MLLHIDDTCPLYGASLNSGLWTVCRDGWLHMQSGRGYHQVLSTTMPAVWHMSDMNAQRRALRARLAERSVGSLDSVGHHHCGCGCLAVLLLRPYCDYLRLCKDAKAFWHDITVCAACATVTGLLLLQDETVLHQRSTVIRTSERREATWIASCSSAFWQRWHSTRSTCGFVHFFVSSASVCACRWNNT